MPGYDELLNHYERQLNHFKGKDIPPTIIVAEGREITPIVGLSEEFRERREEVVEKVESGEADWALLFTTAYMKEVATPEEVENHEPGNLEEDPAARLMHLICLYTPDRKVARFYDKLTLEMIHEFHGEEAEIF